VVRFGGMVVGRLRVERMGVFRWRVERMEVFRWRVERGGSVGYVA